MTETTECTEASPTAPWLAVASRLSSLLTVSDQEKTLLAGLDISDRQFPQKSIVFEEGKEQSSLYICIRGWGARYRLLPDGQRQIIDLILPGTLFGATHNGDGEHTTSAEALMDMTIADLDAQAMRSLSKQAPRLASALALCLTEESAHLSERVVSLGRRDAFERLAHFLLEVYYRQSPDDDSSRPTAHIPIPQQEMADFLGLTNVHVSRTMRKMADKGLIAYDDDDVTIRDKQALAECCDFDPARLRASPIPEPIRNALLNL